MRCFFTVFGKCLQNPMIRQWRKNWDQSIPTFAQKRKCAHWNTARRSHKKPTKTSAKCQVVAGARKVDDALCLQGLAYWNLWSGDLGSALLSTGTCGWEAKGGGSNRFECGKRFELWVRVFETDFKCPYLELMLFDFHEIWNVFLKYRPTNTAQIS